MGPSVPGGEPPAVAPQGGLSAARPVGADGSAPTQGIFPASLIHLKGAVVERSG